MRPRNGSKWGINVAGRLVETNKAGHERKNLMNGACGSSIRLTSAAPPAVRVAYGAHMSCHQTQHLSRARGLNTPLCFQIKCCWWGSCPEPHLWRKLYTLLFFLCIFYCSDAVMHTIYPANKAKCTLPIYTLMATDKCTVKTIKDIYDKSANTPLRKLFSDACWWFCKVFFFLF